MSSQKIYIANLAVMASIIVLTPAFAADGSGTDNPDLLRGSIPAICNDLIFCAPIDINPIVAPPPQNLNASTSPPPSKAPPLINDAPLQLYDGYIVPIEEYQGVLSSPATTFDWSLSLRGAFQQDYRGDRFEVIATPNVSVSHQIQNAQFDLSATANLSKPFADDLDDEFRVYGAAVDFSGSYRIDKDSLANFGANFTIDKASKNDPSLDITIVDPPTTVMGSANASIVRRFAKLSGELRGNISRNVYGATLLTDTTWSDNSIQNNTRFGGGLRLSYEISPIISPFVDFSANRSAFDQTLLISGESQDSNSYVALAGFTGNWRDILRAEISAGYGLTKFDSTLVEDVPTTVFNANLAYNNGKGLDLSANFITNVSAANPALGATTKIDYSTSALAQYQINDWVTARANVTAGWAHYDVIDDIERRHSIGVGADYLLNKHTSFSADYNYGTLETTALGKRENHRFELGVTYSR